MDSHPIGIFDSGVGGLAVLQAVRRRLPGESIVYLADSARMPYGEQSAKQIRDYARACAEFLCRHHVKSIVVACNTVSAVALDVVQETCDVPTIGTILPSAAAALDRTATHVIGVIGTTRTIASRAYEEVLTSLDPRSHVVARAAPELVTVVEQGERDHAETTDAIRNILRSLREERQDIDTLILGCTHFSFLREEFAHQAEKLFERSLTLVDSAEETAAILATMLAESPTLSDAGSPLSIVCSTDVPQFTSAVERLGIRLPASVSAAVLS